MIQYDLWKKKICFVDYETANVNLHRSKNQPWQAAYLTVKNKTVIDKTCHLINWKERAIPISKGAAFITNYNHAKVLREGITPEVAADIMIEKISDADLIVFHNGLGFDVYMANILAEETDREKPFGPNIVKCLDTFALAKAAASGEEYDEEMGELVAWNYGWLDTKVKGRFKQTDLAKSFEIDFDEDKAHDAMYDLEVLCWPIFQKLVYNTKI